MRKHGESGAVEVGAPVCAPLAASLGWKVFKGGTWLRARPDIRKGVNKSVECNERALAKFRRCGTRRVGESSGCSSDWFLRGSGAAHNVCTFT